MAIKIAINGFGRIGRSVARVILKDKDVELAAINDIIPVKSAAYLLKHDTVHSGLEKEIRFDEKNLIIDDKKIPFFNESDPQNLDFAKSGADVVLECSGLFLTSDEVKHHIKKGIKKVIISAPANDDTSTYVLGVNADEYKGESIISNASCTTNCLAPIAKILDKHFGIEKGNITTIHSYTNDQNLLDNFHKRDPRRSRAAAVNMIPTTTGAAKAIGRVLPKLNGKLDGRSVRVPVPNVSLLDFDVILSKNVSKEEVNELFKIYSQNDMNGILGIDEEFRVSGDFLNCSYSSVVALDLTQVVDGNLLKVMSWYDNEWGYANRLVEMAKYISF
ncbi:type I glyceraldehyde-3-phosphate dehydrogenase [Nitrosophilus labii]|uniref:type I glyceraldehyde-3-phosphate dehydrogenase n=1 Tax=Nitrosophilus labii TaxID=2706014 RepID=UPI001656E976|nr:type I glyceraldehyde-3-phosphate dehydrogenase [Nitrosophilus labii]